MPEFFKYDRYVRDESGRPLGKVVLASEFVPGKPIACTLLRLPKQFGAKVAGKVFTIDGVRYRVPEDLPALKITKSGGDFLINNFYLEPVDAVG